ncbi:MAG: hypothetical protein QE485_10685 [Acidovorax sp.]|uniref:hypothetical protein n=1 Tax=Acidovorax sp. TaxID=1872122 RepID=UPI002623D571|nr:hypothetical protein [Acidovorax sp.]MDH4417681.1 hypothetical protein [Acidovorax sp.]
MAPAPFITRVRSARKLGAEAAKKAADRADQDAPGFSERALEHIRVTMLAAAPGAQLRGEDIVNAAKVAGIRPPDDRAFGSIFSKAIRLGFIEPVGFAPRVKGHGTAGGRLYARGEGL